MFSESLEYNKFFITRILCFGMNKGDMTLLSQLVKTLEETEVKLEEAYGKKDSGGFNEAKKSMLKIQQQISKMLK